MRIYWKCTHPQAIRDVDGFVEILTADFKKFSIISLHVRKVHNNASFDMYLLRTVFLNGLDHLHLLNDA